MDELKAQWIATDAHHRGMVMMQLRKIAEQHESDADRCALFAESPSEVGFVNRIYAAAKASRLAVGILAALEGES